MNLVPTGGKDFNLTLLRRGGDKHTGTDSHMARHTEERETETHGIQTHMGTDKKGRTDKQARLTHKETTYRQAVFAFWAYCMTMPICGEYIIYNICNSGLNI